MDNKRFVSDSLEIMSFALGRRNSNDPDANETMFLKYLNDFVHLIMPNDTKLYESFGTMTFIIDESHPTGVYTFNEVGAEFDFVNISQSAFISLLDPINNSVSWNRLPIYQDPGEFYSIWGINNEEILIPGYPTAMLYYGNEFVFRTIPDKQYQVRIYGYKMNKDFETPDEELPHAYWMRYIAYGAALNYARDFRYEDVALAKIQRTFNSERKQMLTHTHNQVKMARAMPRF